VITVLPITVVPPGPTVVAVLPAAGDGGSGGANTAGVLIAIFSLAGIGMSAAAGRMARKR
jgi:hypothetical protein